MYSTYTMYTVHTNFVAATFIYSKLVFITLVRYFIDTFYR